MAEPRMAPLNGRTEGGDIRFRLDAGQERDSFNTIFEQKKEGREKKGLWQKQNTFWPWS